MASSSSMASCLPKNVHFVAYTQLTAELFAVLALRTVANHQQFRGGTLSSNFFKNTNHVLYPFYFPKLRRMGHDSALRLGQLFF